MGKLSNKAMQFLPRVSCTMFTSMGKAEQILLSSDGYLARQGK